jgi:hypothetical protein
MESGDGSTPVYSGNRVVKIKTMDSQVFEVTVQAAMLVSEFKKEVEKVSKIPADRQRLICKAKLLVDDKPVGEFVTEDGQFVHLLKNTGVENNANAQQQNQAHHPQAQGIPPGPQAQMFNPFGALFGAGGAPAGQNVIHFNTVTVGHGQPPPNILFNQIPHIHVQPQPGQPHAHPQQPQQQRPQAGASSTQPAQPQQQPAQPGQGGVRLVSANQRVNELVSVGPNGMEINLRHVDPQGQDQGSTNFTLPHITNMVGEIYQSQGMVNWPLLPRDPAPQNSLTVLGNYLHSLSLQVSLLVPAMQRLSEVAQREQQLSDPLERQRLMILAHQLGRALERLALCVRPCSEILRALRVTNGPGQFGIAPQALRSRANSQAVPQNQPQPAQAPAQQAQSQSQPRPAEPQQPAPAQARQEPAAPQQPQPAPNAQQPFNPFAALSGMFGPQGQGGAPGGLPGPLGGLNLNAILGQLQGMDMEGGDESPLGGLQGMLNQILGGGLMQPPQQAQPQPAPQPQPQQAGQPAEAQPGQPHIASISIQQVIQPGGQPAGFTMASSGDVMNTRIRDININLNGGPREDPDFGDILFGSLLPTEAMGLLSGNVSCLDQRHGDIRNDIKEFVEKQGGVEASKKAFVKSTTSLFLDGLRNNPCVYEGFEPETVTEEVASKHYEGIIACIERDPTPEHPFSKEFLARLQLYMGEVVYEVCEGLVEGIDDFKKAAILSMQTISSRFTGGDPTLGLIFTQTFGGTFWNMIYSSYQAFVAKKNSQEESRTAERNRQTEELLREIQAAESTPSQDAPAFSQAYNQGSLNKK